MSAQATREQRAALALVYAKHRVNKMEAFAVDPKGKEYPMLKRAQAFGWIWFSAPDRCAVTYDALRELEVYR